MFFFGVCCRDLTGVTETDDTRTALLLIDTAGCNLSELDVADNESKGNEGKILCCFSFGWFLSQLNPAAALLEIAIESCY